MPWAQRLRPNSPGKVSSQQNPKDNEESARWRWGMGEGFTTDRARVRFHSRES